MLQVTADIFSGRENPSWVIEDEAEARATLAALAQSQDLLTEGTPADAGLGFRGFTIEPLADDLALDFQTGPSLYLPAGHEARDSRANELAERLIALTERGQLVTQDAIALEVPLRELLTTQLRPESRITTVDESAAAAEPAVEAARAVTCMVEFAAYNPGYWNNNANVRLHNNCYHYASNKRRDTFRTAVAGGGQPGAGCGRIYTAINCAEVTRAALCDGLHHRFNCFPDGEKPRYLVALVIAPGWGPDFHWYRKNKEGFWSHKPGQTEVRNWDQGRKTITDPQFCDRGPYTQFCGYFYTCRSQRIR